MKVAGLFDELSSLCDRRSALLVQFDAAIDKFKTSKDSATFGNVVKTLNQDYAALTAKVNGVISVIMKEDADSQDKVKFWNNTFRQIANRYQIIIFW